MTDDTRCRGHPDCEEIATEAPQWNLLTGEVGYGTGTTTDPKFCYACFQQMLKFLR